MLKPWWERWPGLLGYELDELEAANIPFELVEEARSKGLIVIRLSPTVEGKRLELIARFPDMYPYFRFEVSAPYLNLEHHQHPFSKNLCLIGRATKNWDVEEDTLARFINDRLAIVLKTGSNTTLDEVAGLEEHQGEPYSDYYTYIKDSIIFVDSDWFIDPAITEGILVIGLEEELRLNLKQQPREILLRGAVIEVRDTQGSVLAKADSKIANLHSHRLTCRWVRMSEPIQEKDFGRLFDLLAPRNLPLQQTRWQRVEKGAFDLVGVIFPEEVSWRKNADGWVFALMLQGNPGKKQAYQSSALIRAGRAGRGDLAARVHSLSPLQRYNITVTGLGCIGAPSAIELAKCGVGQLRLVDHDFVDPATVRRWPLGLAAAGFNKADIIKDFIEANYPYTDVLAYLHRIGAVSEDAPADLQVLDEVLSNTNLLYDATAEIGVNYLLSDLAAERRIPYIRISTTPGGWGGLIARIRPGKTEGCWMCLQHMLEDGLIPPPPFDPAGEVQPVGCADPTFTGTAFDTMEVSLAGVRLAASTLTVGAEGGYPDADWDVAVLSLRNQDGSVIAPSWKTYTLTKHPKCRHQSHQE